MELLGRTQADGGGNGFYNFDRSGEQRHRMWMGLTGHTRGVGRTTLRPETRIGAVGGQIGADIETGDGARIGLAGSYDRTWLSDRLGSRGHGDIAGISLYAAQTLGAIGLSMMAGYDHRWQESRRETGVGRAVARYAIDGVTIAGQASSAFTVAGATLTPSLGIVVSRFGGSFTEAGAIPAAFAVRGTIVTRSYASPFAGLGVSRHYTDGHGGSIVPDLSLGYRRSDVATGPQVRLVAADGTRFDGNRAGLSRDTLSLGAGLTAQRGGWTGFVRYRAQVADRWTDHGGTLGIRRAF